MSEFYLIHCKSRNLDMSKYGLLPCKSKNLDMSKNSFLNLKIKIWTCPNFVYYIEKVKYLDMSEDSYEYCKFWSKSVTESKF